MVKTTLFVLACLIIALSGIGIPSSFNVPISGDNFVLNYLHHSGTWDATFFLLPDHHVRISRSEHLNQRLCFWRLRSVSTISRETWWTTIRPLSHLEFKIQNDCKTGWIFLAPDTHEFKKIEIPYLRFCWSRDKEIQFWSHWLYSTSSWK
jgi:hypothetical protein